ncbi:hypothetical protein H6G54_17350 [Anabaena cylindrica FACHB-243]|uniref:hypothetical protein n=1 Tax=Anabaena TaxID=1163 RepID=UPI0005A807C8|nr:MULTISPECIES: hypothetical protein [Anabaena]MBD2419434.1 hypothetical protein [Anabaena cylindrica FACHB-243]MBY5283869.1 hypothetical protein [Anabaena sp. CCAP 1446/1C]MBY5308793.1 hypothetical protein [Anabaena sp. CCAP 1446/1C]MCM2408943.1 hypothetical protein [Anabaena sp. CCAP 1446/1C]BAY00858.1 hypothetical protein NIES19_00840 [Anabaena cylindrica PCC 7122]
MKYTPPALSRTLPLPRGGLGVIFSLSYSFLKWIVGLLVGILLIYIAANFETRRTQINILIRNTINEFENWE